MILSRQKQNFVLDKVIEAIHNSYDYSMDKRSRVARLFFFKKNNLFISNLFLIFVVNLLKLIF